MKLHNLHSELSRLKDLLAQSAGAITVERDDAEAIVSLLVELQQKHEADHAAFLAATALAAEEPR